MNDSTKILNVIKNKIGQREIFKYNRDELIVCLITAINDLSRNAMLLMSEDLATDIIEQFRAILKFIFENSSNENPIYKEYDELTHIFVDMIMEFRENYTPVRNYLEQCSIGTRELLYDEITDTYYEEKFDKFVNFSRIRDRLKDGESDSVKDKSIKSMINYWKRNQKANLFRDRFYKSLMKDYIEACWLDSEIRFEYEFVDFKYSELISFCASLLLIGEYFFINQLNYFYGFLKEEDLINGISRLSDLSKDKVDFFLKYATYDYEYQKDKLTLIQSLIKGKEGYYFCASNLILGLLPIKMCRAIFDIDYKKYEKDISSIARLKEKQMTNSILNTLNKYDLEVKIGYQIKNNTTNKIDAEYDILIYDKKNFTLYIAECKWFYIGDGEEEHNKLDKKIEKAIKERTIKDKFITDNLSSFGLETFGESNIKYVKEFLISQNFMGMKKHSMPVIDFETLKYSIEINASFKEAMDYIYSDKYIDSIDFKGELFDLSIEGYKFKIYKMLGKKN